MTTPEELKRQLKELSDRRSQIEFQVSEARLRLDATGLGMDKPLVDDEGFPIPDVDIGAIRADRQKVRMLSNDHKELTTQMEILLHRLHALSRVDRAHVAADFGEQASITAVGPRAVAQPIAVLSESTRAFAEIDEVTDESPAATYGLHVGDLLVRFGHVTAQTPNAMQAVASLLASSEDREVETVILRDGIIVKLMVTPKKWQGRGLLGCHLRRLL